MSDIRSNRIHDLWIDRATDCLSPAEVAELSDLLKQEQRSDDFTYDELVAAMQEPILESNVNRLPTHIRSQVIDQADSIVGESASPDDVLQPNEIKAEKVTTSAPVSEESVATQTVSKGTSRLGAREVFAWLAMAASLMLALFLWQPERSPTGLIARSNLASLNRFTSGAEEDEILKLEPFASGRTRPSFGDCDLESKVAERFY